MLKKKTQKYEIKKKTQAEQNEKGEKIHKLLSFR